MVRSRSKTDFWRKTFYGYITDNGHFFCLPVGGDFVFQARKNESMRRYTIRPD